LDGSGQEIEKHLHIEHFLDGGGHVKFPIGTNSSPPNYIYIIFRRPYNNTFLPTVVYLELVSLEKLKYKMLTDDGRKVMSITRKGITEPLQSCDLQKKIRLLKRFKKIDFKSTLHFSQVYLTHSPFIF
jgi:hypothetical protein